MAALTRSSTSHFKYNSTTSPPPLSFITLTSSPPIAFLNRLPFPTLLFLNSQKLDYKLMASYRYTSQDEENDAVSFEEAVWLFNNREYYKCHDYLESIWNNSQDPTRTLVHGILQCAVGFHHLFNQVSLPRCQPI